MADQLLIVSRMILKISAPTRHARQAHVLVMVLVVVTICAIALMSYLQLVNAQNRTVSRSQGWNAAVPVTEAGVEEALAHLNANADNGLNVDGWTKIGTYYRMERSVGDSYYVVTITITNTILPIIESRGFCRMPLLVQNNSGPFFLAMPQGYTSPRQGYVGRGVRIKTRRNGSLTKAMLSKGKIDIGGAVNVDSFNSCDPTMSTGGQYDATKAGDGGDIASNGQLVKEISASGNVKIKGHVSTGPGGTTGIDGSVSVGNAAWVDGGNTGVQTGWFRDDMNATIPDAPVAPTGGYTTLNPGGTVNGVYYDSILTSGTYVINGSLSLNSQQQVLVTGDVILVVKNNLSVGGQAQIVIAPSGNLQLFCRRLEQVCIDLQVIGDEHQGIMIQVDIE